MYQVEDEPMETIHLYVVREGRKRPSLVPVIISVLAFSILIAFCALTPYRQPEIRTTIRVPAVPLPIQTFSDAVKVIPTGIKSFPATRAVGTLTITNGSILTEILPKGTIFTGADGNEVITDESTTIPPGSATGLGIAYVSAHAAAPGSAGNIPALDINITEGTSLFIRNTQPFHNGHDAYSIKFITESDRESAIAQERSVLARKTSTLLLSSPCREAITGTQSIQLTWSCEPVTFGRPILRQSQILRIRVVSVTLNSVILDVVFVEEARMYFVPGK